MADAESIDELVNSSDYSPEQHGSLLRLYRAFFDREPDTSGALYWIDLNDNGQSLDRIAEYFTLSKEFARNYDGTSDEEYLAAVYGNVLGRDFDQGGFNYWLDLLEKKLLNRGGVVRWIAANNEFIEQHPYLPN